MLFHNFYLWSSSYLIIKQLNLNSNLAHRLVDNTPIYGNRVVDRSFFENVSSLNKIILVLQVIGNIKFLEKSRND
jgi:hypothetical protein